jgi:hypothetical protein
LRQPTAARPPPASGKSYRSRTERETLQQSRFSLPRIVAEASRLARSDKSVQIFPEIIG